MEYQEQFLHYIMGLHICHLLEVQLMIHRPHLTLTMISHCLEVGQKDTICHWSQP